MDDQDYRGQHLAPGPGSGAPMHDLSQVYPEDIYGPNGFKYYGETGEPSDMANFSLIQSMRGKPNAPVTIYRAIPTQRSTGEELAKVEQDIANYMKRGNLPKDAITQDKSRWYDHASHQRDLLRQKLEQEKNTPQPKITINAGDWVTPNKKYAIDHGNSALNGKYKILSKKVLAKELYTAGDSHHEWGYHPSIKKEDGGGITAYNQENDLLNPIGQSRMVGNEKLMFDEGVYKAGISDFPMNNRKSIRYLHHDENNSPIGALQIMTDGPRSRKATIQNVYVAEPFRRNKIASGLLQRARQDFDVKHSKDLTNAGKAFARAVKSDGGDVDGITAYHGSPHDFEQFDINKLGTGEGAQAFGHGLYFAEHEPVARGYRDQLSRPYYKVNNEDVGKEYGADVVNAIENVGGDPNELKETINRLRKQVQNNLQLIGVSDVSKLRPVYEGDLASTVISAKKRADAIEKLLNSGKIELAGQGHMYEVHINAHPHHFLDWDKPLSEQTEHVQNAVQKMYGQMPAKMSGQDLHDRMNYDLGGADWPVGANFEERKKFVANANKRVAEKLYQHAIKGIKYLDAGSRGTDQKPTHNYVVFNDKDVHVKRKYEQGGRVGFDDGGIVAPITPEAPSIPMPSTITATGPILQDIIQPYDPNKDANLQAAAAVERQRANEQAQNDWKAYQAAQAAATSPIAVGGGGEGGGRGDISGSGGPGAGGGMRDSNNADTTGTTGGNAGGGGDEHRGGRIRKHHYNTGGPVNVSKAEDTAGNYKKEHEKIHGIPVAVEVKEGHDRVKYNPDGSTKFKAKQYADYGAILGTKDADGMDTDVMVGPHKDSEKAYIIDQMKHKTGKFDEHKVMLGFKKRKKAIKAYTKSYADRHGKDRVQDVVKTDIKGLKKWLKHGNLKRPAAQDDLINSALRVVSKKA